MFKSDLKGNDSIAGYSAKSAPIGMYVKQTSFAVMKTDVCHEYTF